MIPKEKESVRHYWDDVPCGTGGIAYPEGSVEYFEAIAENRNRLEPFIADYAQFNRWAGKKILEVGCGVGSDLLRFARAGAQVVGIDLSPKSVSLARSRLQLHNCRGDVFVADAENLPFEKDEFELTYSWGVLHHTPNPAKAVQEIYRVTKPGGEICIMLYHRHSLVALQLYLLFGLFALRPFRSLQDIIASHHESPGTKAYSVAEARQMFSAFKELEIKVRLTPYDLRYKRDKYLPRWVAKLIPQRLGWFMVIRGQKP
jgi:ubiquinone/menaquinone biosynthesis C-methylase UbiE